MGYRPRITLKKKTSLYVLICVENGCLQRLFDAFFKISTERFIPEKTYTFNIDPDVTSVAAR